HLITVLFIPIGSAESPRLPPAIGAALVIRSGRSVTNSESDRSQVPEPRSPAERRGKRRALPRGGDAEVICHAMAALAPANVRAADDIGNVKTPPGSPAARSTRRAPGSRRRRIGSEPNERQIGGDARNGAAPARARPTRSPRPR